MDLTTHSFPALSLLSRHSRHATANTMSVMADRRRAARDLLAAVRAMTRPAPAPVPAPEDEARAPEAVAETPEAAPERHVSAMRREDPPFYCLIDTARAPRYPRVRRVVAPAGKEVAA